MLKNLNQAKGVRCLSLVTLVAQLWYPVHYFLLKSSLKESKSHKHSHGDSSVADSVCWPYKQCLYNFSFVLDWTKQQLTKLPAELRTAWSSAKCHSVMNTDVITYRYAYWCVFEQWCDCEARLSGGGRVFFFLNRIPQSLKLCQIWMHRHDTHIFRLSAAFRGYMKKNL